MEKKLIDRCVSMIYAREGIVLCRTKNHQIDVNAPRTNISNFVTRRLTCHAWQPEMIYIGLTGRLAKFGASHPHAFIQKPPRLQLSTAYPRFFAHYVYVSGHCEVIHAASLLIADTALVSVEKSNFQFILRLLNTNVDGKQKIMYALNRIKGVGRRYSKLV